MNQEPVIQQDPQAEAPKLLFTLEGFQQEQGFRVFLFAGVAADHSRSAFTVKADLSLARRYGIRLQELPLLCRTVAERGYKDGRRRTFAFTEEDMQQYAQVAAARELALRMRRPPRPVGALARGGATSPS
jgi:hypothetical protein